MQDLFVVVGLVLKDPQNKFLQCWAVCKWCATREILSIEIPPLQWWCLEFRESSNYWVAVKGLKLSYHNGYI